MEACLNNDHNLVRALLIASTALRALCTRVSNIWRTFQINNRNLTIQWSYKNHKNSQTRVLKDHTMTLTPAGVVPSIHCLQVSHSSGVETDNRNLIIVYIVLQIYLTLSTVGNHKITQLSSRIKTDLLFYISKILNLQKFSFSDFRICSSHFIKWLYVYLI